MKELLDLAKASPGKLNYANAGHGTASHLSAELMRKMTGVNIVAVAYRATAQALNDTISGEVAMYFPNLVSGIAAYQKRPPQRPCRHRHAALAGRAGYTRDG